jgi:alkylation response protein AidB-like acyl-CoA dehydrogenase
MVTAATRDPLLETVDRIEPVLRQHAADAESRRRLSVEAVRAMREAGLYGMWTPRAYGGLEVDPVRGNRVFEEVARIDSATGWNLALSVSGALFPAFLDERAAPEIYGDGSAVLAVAFFPPGEAVPEQEGFRLKSHTPFGSGSHHCDWFFGLAQVAEAGGTQEQGRDAAPWLVAVPSRDIEIVENWNTLGMRGTGSHDVVIRNAFVPRHRAAPMRTPEQRERLPKGFEGPLYRCTVWPATAALSSVALGIARAALDELLALAARKTPSYTSSPLRERPMAQHQTARAEAKLGAARAYLHEALREIWECALEGSFVTMPHKRKLQLAATHAQEAAAEAVDLVHATVGTSGIREGQRFERHFRDAHVVTQHAYISSSRYESVGRLLFGLESDWGFLAY